MSKVLHQFVEANGIRFHVAECGTGPVVLLCHGFPEIWYYNLSRHRSSSRYHASWLRAMDPAGTT